MAQHPNAGTTEQPQPGEGGDAPPRRSTATGRNGAASELALCNKTGARDLRLCQQPAALTRGLLPAAWPAARLQSLVRSRGRSRAGTPQAAAGGCPCWQRCPIGLPRAGGASGQPWHSVRRSSGLVTRAGAFARGSSGPLSNLRAAPLAPPARPESHRCDVKCRRRQQTAVAAGELAWQPGSHRRVHVSPAPRLSTLSERQRSNTSRMCTCRRSRGPSHNGW
jgi:hypothetical protein